MTKNTFMTEKPVSDSISESVPSPGPSERRGVMFRRKSNLVMLTSQRGSKNLLAKLAGTTGSRISLMTSGRKPVSNPFALAIEDGLKLPRGWLDSEHDVSNVPLTVWSQLGVSNVPSSGSTTRGDTGAADDAKTGQPRSAVKRIGQAAAAVLDVPVPTSFLVAPPAPSSSVRTSEGALFSKVAGQTGPIAEALAKTVVQLSATDKLSEKRAFQILGLILEDLER